MTEMELEAITFSYGHHSPPVGPIDPSKVEACYMEQEALRWAIEHGIDVVSSWTDKLDCVCPSIRGAIIRFNDRCGTGPDANARRKRVLGPLYKDRVVVGTTSTYEVERRRVWLARNWSFRFATPKLLRLTSLAPWADKLEAVAPVTDEASLSAARAVIFAARDAAWRARSEAWGKLRADAATDATDATDAAIDAIDATAATAANAAAAAAAASAAAIDVAIDDAVGAAIDATDLKRIFAAAQKAREAGGGWSDCYEAARKVADEVILARISRPFLSVRDELDDGFADLIRRMAAIT